MSKERPWACGAIFRLAWSEPILLERAYVATLPRAVPGVYVLTAVTPWVPRLVPFYVGQSGDLRRRLLQHLRSDHAVIQRLTARLWTYAALARVDAVFARSVVERSLIAQLRPAANDRVPSTPPAVVNPPDLNLLQ